MTSSAEPVVAPLMKWEILDVAPGEGSPAQLASGGDGWIPSAAPGDTYLALHQAGRIPHPLADENEGVCSWVKDREWWWRTSFTSDALSSGERMLLSFEGLDTYASIWLDGELLGTASNMFTPLRFDISKYLRSAGTHQLLLRFTPPSLVLGENTMPAWPFIADPIKDSKRHYHRKAQFGWGWDWGPKLPTVGIWKPVNLIRQKAAAILDVHFSTLATNPSAIVEVAVSVDAFAITGDRALNVSILMNAPGGGCVAEAVLPTGDGQSTVRTQFQIDRPELWWTPELGKASLYDLIVEIRQGTELLESKTSRVGIRSIKLDTSADPDEPGCDFFRFVLNGVPIFSRGANSIPITSFVASMTTDDYESLLQSAVSANMNMIRVWGGGVYEHDAFYDACDRLGVLVWQDFMFACAPYPDHDENLISSTRRETVSQVIRLRNHPCLALWCGNNEGQCAHELVGYMAGTPEAKATPYPGDLIFEEIFPEILRELDPATPYRQGSPYGGPMHNSMRSGDVHNWTVWHGLPPIPDDKPVGEFVRTPGSIVYTRYAEDTARFVSEFGIQASPARATLEQWVAPENLSLDSPAFLNRIKDYPKDKINAMLLPETGLPTNLDEYVEYTQLLQAEGLKFGIEHYRRRKPHCSGTLIWQYNDCWPGISWSLIDFAGVRKASWFYVARAYAPVMGSFKKLDSGEVELWLTNDTLEDVQIDATVSMVKLTGETIWSQQVSASAPLNSSSVIWRADAKLIAAAPDQALIVRSPKFSGNHLLFAPFKELPLPELEPEVQMQADADGSLNVMLKGRGYHHFVHLQVQDPTAKFSDNYFDLSAGEVRSIRVSAQKPLTQADISVRTFHPRSDSLAQS